MPTEKDPVTIILELARGNPRHQPKTDLELKQIIKDEYRVDLENADEDQLDELMARLAEEKKNPRFVCKRGANMRMHRFVTPKPPQKTSPPSPPALTDFKEGDEVKHLKMPGWGKGHIVGVSPFQMNGDFLQKLDVLFSIAGRKTLIIRPGMLERV